MSILLYTNNWAVTKTKNGAVISFKSLSVSTGVEKHLKNNSKCTKRNSFGNIL